MIRIRNLFKSFHGNSILNGLSLDVCQGEILVILGRSGAGKSVLLRHIIGLEKPDSGTIEIKGQELTKLNKSELLIAVKDMGILFQGAALFDSMSIAENTAFYLRQHGCNVNKRPLSEKEIQEQVAAALTKVGLEGVQDKMPSDLSGGMRKRAGLARLLVYRPSILLYDEPTTGLDLISAGQISKLIVQTQEELKGISIVVTHDIASALSIANRLALHQDGRIVHSAPPQEFLQIDDPMIRSFRNTFSKETFL